MALTQIKSDGIATSAVTTTKLNDDAVSNAKLTSSGTPANRAVSADTVQDDAIGIAALSATGTASSSTFLRGDNSWQAPATISFANDANNRIVTGTGSGLNGEVNLTWDGTDLKATAAGQTTAKIGSTNAGGAAIYLDGDSNGDWAGSDYSWFRHNTDGNLEYNVDNPASNGDHIFSTGGTETVRITSSGNVGIGVAAPGEKFDVVGNARANAFIGRANGSAPTADASIFRAADNTLAFATANTERFRIESTGKMIGGATGIRPVANQNGNGTGDGTTARYYAEGVGDSTGITIVSNGTNAWRGSCLNLARSRGASVGANTIIADGDSIGQICFNANDGVDFYTTCAQIEARVDGAPAENDTPGRLVFKTTPDGSGNAAERMRIDSVGRMILGTNSNLESNYANMHINTFSDGGQGGLYIHCNGQGGGTAAPHYGLKIDAHSCANNANLQAGILIDVNQQLVQSQTGVFSDVQGNYSNQKCFDAYLNKSLGAYTDGFCYYSNIVTSSSGGSAFHAYFTDNGTLKFRIYQNGNTQNANNSWGSTSDVKLKENIVDANSQWSDIKAVRVRNFNFRASTGQDTSKHIGVIAQELETVSPGLVHTDTDTTLNEATGEGTVTGTTQSVKYSILYMKAIKALQEAMARIETLETKVAALEAG